MVRNNTIMIRISTSDKNKIIDKVKESGETISDYLRKLLMLPTRK